MVSPDLQRGQAAAAVSIRVDSSKRNADSVFVDVPNWVVKRI